MNKGFVYWFTGLAGAGKSTLGHLFYQYLKARKPNIVFLDGDHLREIFGNSLGFSREERIKGAHRNSRLCKMLSDQGIDVVCTTISMFFQISDWNRKNMENYREIYIKVPMDILVERDQKQLYSQALNGEIQHVMGIDIEAEEPIKPELIIQNDGVLTPEEVLDILIDKLL